MKTPYEDVLRDLLAEYEKGARRADRTGVGTVSLAAQQIRYDLNEGFPLLTTKKVFYKNVISELLWMLSGSRNIRPLVEQNNHIWDDWPFKSWAIETGKVEPNVDSKTINELMGNRSKPEGIYAEFLERIKNDDEFAEKYGDLGPVYGFQWRHWPDFHENSDGSFTKDENGIDQIAEALRKLKEDPTNRRNIVSAWNTADIDEMTKRGLPPCHYSFQFWVGEDERLTTIMNMRSADMFLGVPFNIASYAFLTEMMAQQSGLKPGEVVINMGDCHMYLNHADQIREQLLREPRPLPTLELEKAEDIFSYKVADFAIKNYDPHAAIKAPIAV